MMLARSEEFWSNLYDFFLPDEILAGDRGELLYHDWRSRCREKLHQIFRINAKTVRPPIGFLAGHRGTGKSSFLFRLIDRYRDDFLVVDTAA